MPQDYNETQSLTIMIYSSVFPILHMITYFLFGTHISKQKLILCHSLVYGFGYITSLSIYMLPKLLLYLKDTGSTNCRSSSMPPRYVLEFIDSAVTAAYRRVSTPGYKDSTATLGDHFNSTITNLSSQIYIEKEVVMKKL